MNARRWIVALSATTAISLALAVGIVIGVLASDDGNDALPFALGGDDDTLLSHFRRVHRGPSG